MAKRPVGFDELVRVVSEQTALDIIEHRNAKRAKLTARAARGIATQLEMIPQHKREEAVDEWLNRGWVGFKAQWVNNPQNYRDANNPVKAGGSPKTFSDERQVPMAVNRAPLPENHFMNRWKQ